MDNTKIGKLQGPVENFRKIDVDALDEDVFRDDEGAEKQPNTGPSDSDVKAALNGGKLPDALHAALKSPPFGNKDKKVRSDAVALVVKVLVAFKPDDMDKAISALSTSEHSTLMKYIYKGFEIPSESSSATLLVWHDKMYKACGAGAVLRVLTDHRQL